MNVKFQNIKDFLKILLLGLILSIIFTWPLVIKLSSFYNVGDYSLIGWVLKYNYDSILNGKIFNQQLYFNAPQFYPFAYSLAYSDNLLLPSILFAPIYWLTNNLIFSQNFLLLFSFMLTFLACFYSLQFFIKNKFASIIGATIYSFNPLTFAHFPGHFQLMNKFLLPLIYLYTYKYLKYLNFKNAVLFWIFFSLNLINSVYFFVFSILQTVIIFFIFVFVYYRNNINFYILKLFKTLAISIPFVIFILYFSLPYLDFSKKENINRSTSETVSFSASPSDFLRPLPNNIVYKYFSSILEENVPTDFNYAEHVLSLNFVPFVIALVSLISLYKIRKRSQNNLFRFWSILVLLISFFILSFGPYLDVIFTTIKLPYYFLKKYSPIFSGVRAPSRLMFMFYFPFCLAIGYGFLYMLKEIKAKKYIIFLIVMSLITFENLNINNLNEVSKTESLMEKYKQKNSQIFKILKGKNAIHFPIEGETYKQSIYLTWSTYTDEVLMNGYSGFAPDEWTKITKKMIDTIDKDSLKIFQLLDIQYIVIHKTNKNFYINSNFYLNTIFEDNNIKIISVKKNKNYVQCLSEKKLSISKELGYKIIVTNNNDCYIINKYVKRYLELPNNKFVTLPIIINPKEMLRYDY